MVKVRDTPGVSPAVEKDTRCPAGLGLRVEG